MSEGILIVMSGPSGVGKSTIVSELLKNDPRLHFSVSVTTRGPRKGEADGRDYYFVTREKFEEMIAADEFLEYARYTDNYYGTPEKTVRQMLSEGRDVLLDVEVQGAMQIDERRPDALKIFILPPDMNTLEARLRGRGANDDAAINRRIQRAREELKHAERYDYQVVNDYYIDAAKRIGEIIAAERQKRGTANQN